MGEDIDTYIQNMYKQGCWCAAQPLTMSVLCSSEQVAGCRGDELTLRAIADS